MNIYDITDVEIRTQDPDSVKPDELQPGDKVARWLYATIAISSMESAETVLTCFVASIQPYKKFKVYCDFGDTTDIHRCANFGRKVRSEPLAREVFPLLNEYEFIAK